MAHALVQSNQTTGSTEFIAGELLISVFGVKKNTRSNSGIFSTAIGFKNANNVGAIN